jgi:spoIIIJ-associated protein
MEWVETTGRTVEAALDAALDELGVAEDEVEYEVLEAPRAGFLGRKEARIRARVRPLSREKPGDRRRRGGKRDSRSPAPATNGGRSRGTSARTPSGEGARRRSRGRAGSTRGPGDGSGGGRGGSRNAPPKAQTDEEHRVDEADISIEDQAAAAEDFTRGLIDAFDVDATVTMRIDDDTVLVDVTGPELGLLVGPKGTTLQSIEELVRTVVQRQTEGRGARINVDVAGYRAKRREALERFVQELAQKVQESGKELALEPMSAADRKVVHDTIAPIEGLTTLSEGEEPRRHVVVRRG